MHSMGFVPANELVEAVGNGLLTQEEAQLVYRENFDLVPAAAEEQSNG